MRERDQEPARRRATQARKERRKAEEGAKALALEQLREATAAESVDGLDAALKAALALSCDGGEAVDAAQARLAQLRDPDWQKRKERELRAAAAEKRLGGLTAAQQKFMMGQK